jgi:FkbM family methyltransferase
MNLQFFLYRRLCQWITCEVFLPSNLKIKLASKYEVASFSDVFCHPFYWQVYSLISTKPKLIVDCGANCGHFSLLIESCIKVKFPDSEANYILIEPNPLILKTLQSTLEYAGMNQRCVVKQGLLGKTKGEDYLWINNKNYLTSGLFKSSSSKSFKISYLDLAEIIGDQVVDLMKIDIEGGEYDFVRSNLSLFQQVNCLFMEIHQMPRESQNNLITSLESLGFQLLDKIIQKVDGSILVILSKKS